MTKTKTWRGARFTNQITVLITQLVTSPASIQTLSSPFPCRKGLTSSEPRLAMLKVQRKIQPDCRRLFADGSLDEFPAVFRRTCTLTQASEMIKGSLLARARDSRSSHSRKPHQLALFRPQGLRLDSHQGHPSLDAASSRLHHRCINGPVSVLGGAPVDEPPVV